MSEILPGPVEQIDDRQIETELHESYLTYAMSTIMDRALPDVRDGLKPSQRRVLVAMNDLHLSPGRKHIKCAKIAGDTSGNYHPHGEAVIYPTMVRMAQNWCMRYMLVDGQGNFGSNDGDPPAAMRYTEARMTAPTVDVMADLDLDTVDFQPNYDERMMEPTVLPSKFPSLLVNGSTGIAVGMACNLLPHNLREICNAIVHVIDNPDCSLIDLLEIVPGPDFPTGGIICGRDGIVEGYKSGRGRLTLRAKMHAEEKKGERAQVIIDEIPYGVLRRSIVESIADHAKDDIKEISDVNDHSGREHACRIVVDLKRDADPNIIINQLYEYTPCQITVSMINIALVNRQPRTMGLKELIQHFIAHRKEVIIRRTRFLLKKSQQRGHILEGLIFAVCDIDEVVRLIRSSKTREEAIQRLRARAFQIAPTHPDAAKIPHSLMLRVQQHPHVLSNAQAEAIGALRLIQLVGLEIEKLVEEYRQVVEQIEGYERILADESLVMAIIRTDTFEMRDKYGDDRRTEITGEVSGLNMEDLIARTDVVVTVSHAGYIKRLPIDTYQAQGRGGRGIRGVESKEGDFVDHLFIANTHDYILFFTDKGRAYSRRVYDIPELSRTSAGRSIAQFLEFQPDEKIANVLAVPSLEKDELFVFFATARGVVKKTALSAFASINRRGIIAIGLDELDRLIGVDVAGGADHILLGTKSGLAIRFEETEVRAMGRQAGGVTGARFKREGDEVVSMLVIQDGNNEGRQVLTVCVNGFGKRTPLADYPVKGRGTRGVINIDATERNGEVVKMELVCDTDQVMLITEKGILIRTRVSEIRETGRNAAGVRVIRVDGRDRLVAMARVDITEQVDEGVPEGEQPADGATPAAETPATPPAPDADTPKAPSDPDAPDAPDAPESTPGADK